MNYNIYDTIKFSVGEPTLIDHVGKSTSVQEKRLKGETTGF